MCMNTLWGKTFAIWLFANRPLAACIFFLVGFIPPMLRYLKARLELRNRMIPIVEDTPYKPTGTYRI